MVSCYAKLTREVAGDELLEMYRGRFAGEPFVEVTDQPPGVIEVRDTNLCRICPLPAVGGDLTLVFGAIDNLWKGASSQAVQNLNLMFGLSETEGIS
jgi:N-acetyl-gamma-glutamyl-phosphate reductase